MVYAYQKEICMKLKNLNRLVLISLLCYGATAHAEFSNSDGTLHVRGFGTLGVV